MRLSRYLSMSGVASRRASEEIIGSGRVKVNGVIVRDPATAVDTGDLVDVDDARVQPVPAEEKDYIIFNKPIGVISTMSVGREKGLCIADVVKFDKRVYPVGRLDRDSSGLILLTNDGEMANSLTHPRHRVSKEYIVTVGRKINTEDLRRIYGGIIIEGRVVKVESIFMINEKRVSISIHEGRKHIIRKLFKQLKYSVADLKRVRIGPILLGKLGYGKWRKLRKPEIETLRNAI